MTDKLIEITTNLKEALEKNRSSIHLKTKHIDKSFFHEKYKKDANITAESFFLEFNDIKSPVLYWFEINTTKVSKEAIRNKYEGFLENNKLNLDTYRNPSAIKIDYSKAENTLYVGKVKNGFWGRLVTHLGYNTSRKTAGMQLFYWYDIEQFGDLTLNYVVLNREMENLVAVLEVELAKELKPLIGRY